MTIPTVTLELLREGPPHNQLLSPLTPYLALCGNHEPEVVRVPFEHGALLRRLGGLRYHGDRRTNDIDAEELRNSLVQMLRAIRSLASALSAAASGNPPFVVLELVLSASELALLPFELVFHPGKPSRDLAPCDVLVLRRTRRVPASRLRWPYRPRILFAYAEPSSEVPAEDHVLALREALDPWLVHVRDGVASAEVARGELAKYVTLLPHASIDDLQAECSRANAENRGYTHVHILAHGAGHEDGKVGLLMHHSTASTEVDMVSGARLAAALFGSADHGPTCVSVAACYGGDVGDVAVTGGSVAHDLHDRGIPFVVASQLPLTFTGSKVLARELFEHLLWVTDPRKAVHSTRAVLGARSRRGIGSYDWASLVTYVALPSDLQDQLPVQRLKQARRAAESYLAIFDDFVLPSARSGKLPRDDRLPTPTSIVRAKTQNVAPGNLKSQLEAMATTAAPVWKSINGILTRATADDPPLATGNRRDEKYGRGAESAEDFAWTSASIHKRWAEIISRRIPSWNGVAPDGIPIPEACDYRRALRIASEQYRVVFHVSGRIEAMVQWLACQTFLQSPGPRVRAPAASTPRPRLLADPGEYLRYWQSTAALIQLHLDDASLPMDRALEFRRALLELWLQQPIIAPDDGSSDLLRGLERRGLDSLRRAFNTSRRDYETHSLWRQLGRYVWWCSAASPLGFNNSKGKQITQRVDKVVKILVAAGSPPVWPAVVDWRRSPSGYYEVAVSDED